MLARAWLHQPSRGDFVGEAVEVKDCGVSGVALIGPKIVHEVATASDAVTLHLRFAGLDFEAPVIPLVRIPGIPLCLH